MLKLFLPDQQVKSIFEIKPEQLREKGIKGVITDLDNTLVAWNEAYPNDQVYNWFKQMEQSGIEVMILSNNNKNRVELFSKSLKRPYVYKANKPLKRSFIKAAEKMNIKRSEIVVIGDQLLTDVLGGNRSGFQTILVVPIVDTDDKITKFNRSIERFILNKLEKRGLIKWEE
ncbi:YqeG family HAD IIIA-type phosphatase [Amphibacillus sp. MSJ-3]|uniref:YqeG family HAD IIIA-type phosphatase n=1 Tax=Amphibacillus sp. MSJ-3 TaxID=2841505 RepID=UPI001C0EBB88|nr:YqeG family HAD IIIA-type phosphatase [Amphibacillus sp. MSJ-3]MBU5595314.1 YqeG family HAD IIIA-type phosphatase [Amphibacillus sp. MSJ-3]